jgi:hypothetical protein
MIPDILYPAVSSANLRRSTLRHILSCLIVLCWWAAPAFTQNPSNSSSNAATIQNDSEVIQQIEDDWLKGENTTDIAVLERVSCGRLRESNPARPWANQAGAHKAPSAQFRPFASVLAGDGRYAHLHPRRHGVAAYTKTYTAKENGNLAHEDTTHIFTKDRGTWKLRISRASIREAGLD